MKLVGMKIILYWYEIHTAVFACVACVNTPNALWKPLYVNHIMDVVWVNRFKLNRFETSLSASVNGAMYTASQD